MPTRFAPSPTGYLHLGHIYAAKFARDLAHKNGTQFLLRFEDIDTTRVRDIYYQEIEHDLKWLGLDWHGPPLRQTARKSAYSQALDSLKSLRVIYPCFCTRREIQQEITSMHGAPHIENAVPVYPGTCRDISPDEQIQRINSGQPHCWRLNSKAATDQTGTLYFNDHIHGHTQVSADLLGDVVLARKDIGTSYHIAVVVDDAMQKITHVTRGEDLLSSTHVHRILQKLLKLPSPDYHHHHLIVDTAQKRLAKRNQSLSIRSLREQHKTPAEVLAMISL